MTSRENLANLTKREFNEALNLAGDIGRYDYAHNAFKYAAHHALDASGPALHQLAIRMRDGARSTPTPNGWKAFIGPETGMSDVNIVVANSKESEPGGILLNLNFHPEHTESATAEIEKLRKEEIALLIAQGASERDAWSDVLIQEVLKKPKSGRMTDILRILEDEKNILSPNNKSKLSGIKAFFVDFGNEPWDGYGAGGKPVSAEDAATLDVILKDLKENGYSPAKIFDYGPPIGSGTKVVQGTFNLNKGGCESVFTMISDVLAANGFARLISQRSAEVAKTADKETGVKDFDVLKSFGTSLLQKSDGRFSVDVERELIRLSREMAAKTLSDMLSGVLQLAKDLVSNNKVTRESAYDCNDMRDIVYAGTTSDGYFLESKTQNGVNRLIIRANGDEVLSVETVKMGKGLTGRFKLEGGVLVADFEGSEGKTEIKHDIRNIKDLNNLLLSLNSTQFCWVEEMTEERMSL